jgi:hypothetical protein
MSRRGRPQQELPMGPAVDARPGRRASWPAHLGRRALATRAERRPSPCTGQADDVSIPSCSQMAVWTWAAGPVASTATMTSLARNNSRTGRVFTW